MSIKSLCLRTIETMAFDPRRVAESKAKKLRQMQKSTRRRILKNPTFFLSYRLERSFEAISCNFKNNLSK